MRGLCWRHLDLIGYPVDLTRATKANVSARDVNQRRRIGRVNVMEGWVSKFVGVQTEALCLADIPPGQQMTDLCGELVQWVGVYGVDGKRVVSVNGSEAGRD